MKKKTRVDKFLDKNIEQGYGKPIELLIESNIKGFLCLRAIVRTIDKKKIQEYSRSHSNNKNRLFKVRQVKKATSLNIQDNLLSFEHKIVYVEIKKPSVYMFIKEVDSRLQYASEFWADSVKKIEDMYRIGQLNKKNQFWTVRNYWNLLTPQYLLYIKSRKFISANEKIFFLNKNVTLVNEVLQGNVVEHTGIFIFYKKLLSELREELISQKQGIECPNCKALFISKSKNKKYCSPSCCDLFKTNKYKAKNKNKVKDRDRRYQKERRAFYKSKNVSVNDLI